MKKIIILFIFIIGAASTYRICGQTQDNRIRKIARDFLASRNEWQEDVDLYANGLIVYDWLHKEKISADECLPIRRDLLCYSIATLNSHSISYIMLVKNGNYEIIDMAKKLDDILIQLITYSKQQQMGEAELLTASNYIFHLYKVNILNAGGVPVIGSDYSKLLEIVKAMLKVENESSASKEN